MPVVLRETMMRHRKLNRLADFDYSSQRLYFVTTCTKDRQHFFGEIENNQMQLNTLGKIAKQQWDWLANQYPYIRLHAFVVMPNHIHGVLEIHGDGVDENQKIKPLSQLMGAYKTTSSKRIHEQGYGEFSWQRSFHDHIIRDNDSYEKIIDYVNNNPNHWVNDCFNEWHDSSVHLLQ